MASLAIVIVDDESLLGESLAIALRAKGLRDITWTKPERLAAVTASAHPGLAVVTLRPDPAPRGRIDAAGAVEELRAAGWGVVALTDRGAPQPWVAHAVVAGAAGVLDGSDSLDALLRHLATVATGRSLMGHEERERWRALHRWHQRRERLLERLRGLSTREHEVLHLLHSGHRASCIAPRLLVSVATVRTLIRGIFTKLDVNSQLEVMAFLHSLLTPQGDATVVSVMAESPHRCCGICGFVIPDRGRSDRR